MKISMYGLDCLKSHEGSVIRDGLHRVYDDATGREITYGGTFKGFPTIGYGHLLTRAELNLETIEILDMDISYWNGISEEQAVFMLDRDLDWAEDAVNKYVSVPLNQNQFDALVSFTFNIGATAFKKSTLLRLLNAGEYDEVPTQLNRWIRSGGVVMNGLIKRRLDEGNLFVS